MESFEHWLAVMEGSFMRPLLTVPANVVADPGAPDATFNMQTLGPHRASPATNSPTDKDTAVRP